MAYIYERRLLESSRIKGEHVVELSRRAKDDDSDKFDVMCVKIRLGFNKALE